MKKGTGEIVVDGYNLIHKLYPSPGKMSLTVLRREAEKKLLCFQQEKKCMITMVYDAKGNFRESDSGAALRIVFTSKSKSADHWIIDYVKSLNTKVKMVTIVSSDDEIRRYATAFGAKCIKSEAFAVQLKKVCSEGPIDEETGNKKKRHAGLLCDQEIAVWMKLFTGDRS